MSEEAKEAMEEKQDETPVVEAKQDEAPAAEEAKVDAPVVDGKMAEFIDWIEGISVLELSKLVKALEVRLGVSAAAPMAMAAMPGGGGDEGPAEEQTEFTVVLVAFGEQKIAVIKEVRAITGLGLKDSKDLVEAAPKPVKEGVTKEEAEAMKKKLEEAGATVEVK